LKIGALDSAIFFEMKIRNNGPVIPPETLQNVFNPFFTTKEHGTGLGLTVSKKIVEDHGGSISVKSDEDGTAFTIWLPLKEIPSTRKDFCLFQGNP
ncbi:MAG: ATP-binding protein, partial [Desulfomonilaceae bacterium]